MLPLDSKLSKRGMRLRPVADGVEAVVDPTAKPYLLTDRFCVSQARMADGGAAGGNTLFVLRWRTMAVAPGSETACCNKLPAGQCRKSASCALLPVARYAAIGSREPKGYSTRARRADGPLSP